jgi:hypothetical protein
MSCSLKIVEKWLPATGAFSFAHEQGVAMSVQVEVMAPILNAGHRCDRCGSRAYVVTGLKWSATLRNGGELLWCSHHYNQHRATLEPLTSVLIDERAQLTRHIEDDRHIV